MAAGARTDYCLLCDCSRLSQAPQLLPQRRSPRDRLELDQPHLCAAAVLGGRRAGAASGGQQRRRAGRRTERHKRRPAQQPQPETARGSRPEQVLVRVAGAVCHDGAGRDAQRGEPHQREQQWAVGGRLVYDVAAQGEPRRPARRRPYPARRAALLAPSRGFAAAAAGPPLRRSAVGERCPAPAADRLGRVGETSPRTPRLPLPRPVC